MPAQDDSLQRVSRRLTLCADRSRGQRPEPVARLFIALWPGPAARRALRDWAAGWSWPAGAAVVPPERLHLTLHFIGPTPVRRLPELTRALAVPAPRFALALGRAEVWSRGLAVLTPCETPAALVELHAALADALRRLEVPVEERAFRPHLTLARKASGATPPGEPARLAWPVRQYALVQSAHGYRTLARFPS